MVNRVEMNENMMEQVTGGVKPRNIKYTRRYYHNVCGHEVTKTSDGYVCSECGITIESDSDVTGKIVA